MAAIGNKGISMDERIKLNRERRASLLARFEAGTRVSDLAVLEGTTTQAIYMQLKRAQADRDASE